MPIKRSIPPASEPIEAIAAEIDIPALGLTPVYHTKAKCRWCGARFRKAWGFQWICEDELCARRQFTHAMLKPNAPIDAESTPFLFLPLPFQCDVEDNPTKRLLIHGATGVAKSYFVRWFSYKRCRQIPGFRVLLLRCTYDQLNKNHLQYIPAESKMFGADLCKWTGLNGTNARQVQFFHGEHDPESIIFMGHCADEGDIKDHVGPEWDLIIPEEGVTFLPKALREITARDRGNALSRPYREKIGLKGQTRIPTNPGGRAMMYLKDLYIDKAPSVDDFADYNPKYYAQISGDITDNPYLEDDYEQASLGHLDAIRHAQLAEGRWDVFEGQFFSSFSPLLHVRDMEPR